LKSLIRFNELDKILYKDNFKVYEHEKFFKELSLSAIIVKNTEYTLKVSSHKRVLIFDSDNKFINTLPHQLEDGKLLTKLSESMDCDSDLDSDLDLEC
jgi:hypothetical protein